MSPQADLSDHLTAVLDRLFRSYTDTPWAQELIEAFGAARHDDDDSASLSVDQPTNQTNHHENNR